MSELADSDYRVRELVARVGESQNLVSYHLRLLRAGHLVTARRSSFDGRDSYYHLDVERCAVALAETGAVLHPALRRESPPHPPPMNGPGAAPVGVLFVCTGNSARSPMAEALLRHHAGGQVEVASAGTRPRTHIHPAAIRVLREEFGINITGRRPQAVDASANAQFDYLVSLCDKAREDLPDSAGRPRQVHWSLADPAASGDTGRTLYRALHRCALTIDTRIRHLLPVLTAASAARPASHPPVKETP